MPSIAVASEEEWMAVREQYVGGSEVASLFYEWFIPGEGVRVLHLYEEPPEGARLLGCLSSFESGYRLWLRKAGLIEPNQIADNERMQAGRYIEPALAAWAREKWPEWDGKLRKVRRYLAHPTVPGWGSSLDYELVQPGGYPPVEFKNVDFLIFRDQWVREEDVIVPPLKIMLQVQAQIGVAHPAEFGWCTVCVGGNELLRGRIPRHEPTQQRIEAAVSAFWHGVRNGLKPVHVADAESVAEEYRYGDRPENENDEIAPLDLTGDPELAALCRRWKRWKAFEEGVTGTIGNIKARICAKLGAAPRGRADGFRVSWPAIHVPEQIVHRVQKERNYRGGLTVTEVKDKPPARRRKQQEAA